MQIGRASSGGLNIQNCCGLRVTPSVIHSHHEGSTPSGITELLTFKIYKTMKDKNGKKLKIGDCVIWHDPDETTRDLSRIWAIDKIKGEVITISDDYSEAEVYSNEIELYV